MEAPPDAALLAAAPAPATLPLRAPEVARLRQEQEKVTGRGPGCGGARSPRSLSSSRPRPLTPDPGPSTPPSGARAASGPREAESDRRKFSHVLLLSCLPPFDLGAGARPAEVAVGLRPRPHA